MKRLVARVEVYLDDDPNGDFSHSAHEEGSKYYEILVNPAAEKRTIKHADSETIMAHEFGHLIADIHGYPEQRVAGFQWLPPFMKVEGERTAWRIAEKIWPKLDKATRDEALNTYSKWGWGRE